MSKAIGPSFSSELRSAGLFGLHFAWEADGAITFGADMTQEQVDAVNAVYAAHDPTKIVAPSVAASQAKIQLLRSGLLDAVKAAVAAADAETQLWFAEAATWHPDNAHVLALATQLGISPDQKAALFTSASAIV